MISTTTYHGDLDDPRISLRDVDPDELIGEIVVVSHPDPASGHMGKSMARVTKAETVEIEENEVEIKENREVRKRVRVGARDVLLNRGYSSVIGRFPPDISFPQEGSVYRVFAKEHLNGRGKWVQTSKWNVSQFYADHEYTGHEETRMKYREAEYVGNNEVGTLVGMVETREGTTHVEPPELER